MADRYRADGHVVYQGETIIIQCSVGDQGQAPEAIAERVAALLNADFHRFCVAVCHEAGARTRTHGEIGVQP